MLCHSEYSFKCCQTGYNSGVIWLKFHDCILTPLSLLRHILIFIKDIQHQIFENFCAIHPLYNPMMTAKRHHLKQSNIKQEWDLGLSQWWCWRFRFCGMDPRSIPSHVLPSSLGLHIRYYKDLSTKCEWDIYVCLQSRKALVKLCHPSFHLYHCSFHLTDFFEIWHWGPLWKSVKKTNISLKSDKLIGHLTQRLNWILLLLVT